MSYRDFCTMFCGDREIKNLDNQKYLQRYITVFKIETANFNGGIFVVEPSGIFRPIQDTSQGVVCFCKMPFSRQKVYALHDGYKSVFAEYGKFFIIFPNVFEVSPEIGYNFISDVNSLYPISATIPSNEKVYYSLKAESEIDTISNHSNTDDDEETRNFFNEEEDEKERYWNSRYNPESDEVDD